MATVVHRTANALVVRDDGEFADMEDELGTSFTVFLTNFRLNRGELFPDHIDVIDNRIVPYVQTRIGFAEIYALTDRSGSRRVNYAVGGKRLQAVQQRMFGRGAPSEKTFHRFAKSLGEDFQDQVHPEIADGTKDSMQRSVVIALSPAIFPAPSKAFRGFLSEIIRFGRTHVQQPK